MVDTRDTNCNVHIHEHPKFDIISNSSILT